MSELKDELLLYCLKTHQAFCLNPAAAAVYQTADGSKSTTEIADTVSKELKSKVTEDFVLFTLDELKSQNLMEFAASDIAQTNGFSRREAIRRIGLSTAVALPIITMLVAPKAVEAQSGTACATVGNACTGGSLTLPVPQGTCCAGLVCCQPPVGNGTCGPGPGCAV